jgi:hypothetical protein
MGTRDDQTDVTPTALARRIAPGGSVAACRGFIRRSARSCFEHTGACGRSAGCGTVDFWGPNATERRRTVSCGRPKRSSGAPFASSVRSSNARTDVSALIDANRRGRQRCRAHCQFISTERRSKGEICTTPQRLARPARGRSAMLNGSGNVEVLDIHQWFTLGSSRTSTVHPAEQGSSITSSRICEESGCCHPPTETLNADRMYEP